jgi:magnesium transporter
MAKEGTSVVTAADRDGLKMFVFFSELQGRVVVDTGGRPIGKLDDLKTRLGELFPKITSLIIKKGRRKKPLSLAWGYVESFDGEVVKLLPDAESRFAPLEVGSDDLLLKADLLDKQVVDTFGAKIERVNDIHLLIVNKELRLVHVDFGIRGILRRLSWIRTVDSFTDWLFAYRFQEKMASWKYVQPLARDPQKKLKLNLTLRKLHEIHPSDLADIL